MRLTDERHPPEENADRQWELLWHSTDAAIQPLVQALHVAFGGDDELTTIALDWESCPSLRDAVAFSVTGDADEPDEPHRVAARREVLIQLIVEVHRQRGLLLDLLTCDAPEVRLAAILALRS